MKWPGTFRFLILLLAIASVLGVATAASSPAHFHANPPSSGCDVCFAAHVASLEARTVAALIHTPVLYGHVTLLAARSGYRLFRSSASLTRGPPL
jgi:hypothetical protein